MYCFCILYFFRPLQEKLLLVKGELGVPVQFDQTNLEYKFVVIRKARGKEKKDEYVWEHLKDQAISKNRNLVIPKTKLKEGGKFLFIFLDCISKRSVFIKSICIFKVIQTAPKKPSLG